MLQTFRVSRLSVFPVRVQNIYVMLTVCIYFCSGDGKHNGLELGDPCCVWSKGGTAAVSSGLSHPGRDDSTTSNIIPESCKDVCDGFSPATTASQAIAATVSVCISAMFLLF